MLSDEEKRKIEAEAGRYPSRRAALSEALMIAQEARGWVSDGTLAEAAQAVGISAEAAESVATFYELVYRRPVGAHVILACDSVSCWIRDGESIIDALRSKLGVDLGGTTKDGLFTLLPAACLGLCEQAPAIMIDGEAYGELTVDKLDAILEGIRGGIAGGPMATPLTARIPSGGGAASLADYRAAGGYLGLEAARAAGPAAIAEAVKAAGLRGRGGAGFPTAMKWAAVPPPDGGPRYLVVNADEKEPGTMKDRYLMEGDPHQLIEGIVIAALAIEARVAYIYLRREYGQCARELEKAMAEASAAGLLEGLELHLHLGAGRYMCGEETGLLNAIEGKRATPRNKPPFPQVSGLWGRPTVVNNVETLCNLPHILREGADWYKSISSSSDGGTKVYGASGWVARPGLWELPLGATAAEILETERAACPRAERSAASSRAAPPPTSSPPPSSTSRWTSTPWPPRARGSARGR